MTLLEKGMIEEKLLRRFLLQEVDIRRLTWLLLC
nr:MAG TPA: hypothetical protein [Caudoviricetes sp.]